MATMQDLRNGMLIEFKDSVYEIVEFLHVKPGKGPAFTRAKLKSLKNGRVIDNTFRDSDKFNEVKAEKTKKNFLYHDGDFYVFMDKESYEQISVPNDVIGDLEKFLTENIEVTMLMDMNSNILGIDLPITVEMEIVECEPNVKGNTAASNSKSATTNTGLAISIPFFVEVGTRIRVDTRTGDYIERI